ncbi:isoaspartyl peptidase/L-asparaginase-like [Saccostrea cucullata]|uniref:isoaspartyl peptidase/L-asparaginase-like n=1 Tax=Saccostrea cuccullata TaxID=36930 RepID=UPI002ED69143
MANLSTCEPIVVIHGGAWAIPDKLSSASVDGVCSAARAGYGVLKRGGTAVDAVEAAVLVMEDCPAFDAGTGSVLNTKGEVEMDSVIMDGRQLQCGSVACVQNIKNPVSLARAVMEKTDHTLLVGQGANEFAEEIGIHTVPTDSLVTEDAREEWRHFMKFKTTVNALFRNRAEETPVDSSVCDTIGHDTVGAVALDKFGNTAAATSTGGITAKRPGRVGDSPIVGSGAYADNDSGAVSTTGHGESITKVCLAREVTHRIEEGMSAQEASEAALQKMNRRVQGSGGVVAVSKGGDIGKHFTTERMAWAWIKAGKLHYGLNSGEDFVEDI